MKIKQAIHRKKESKVIMENKTIFDHVLNETERMCIVDTIVRNPRNRSFTTQDIVRAVHIEQWFNMRKQSIPDGMWERLGLMDAVNFINRSHNTMKRALSLHQKLYPEIQETFTV